MLKESHHLKGVNGDWLHHRFGMNAIRAKYPAAAGAEEVFDGLGRRTTIQALAELRPVSHIFQKLNLKIPEEDAHVAGPPDEMKRVEEQFVDRIVLHLFGGESIGEFGKIESLSRTPEVGADREETLDDLALRDRLKVPPVRKHERTLREGFHVTAEFAPRAANSLGHRSNFAKVGGIEREDSIRFAKVGVLEDNSLGLVRLGLRHGDGDLLRTQPLFRSPLRRAQGRF